MKRQRLEPETRHIGAHPQQPNRPAHQTNQQARPRRVHNRLSHRRSLLQHNTSSENEGSQNGQGDSQRDASPYSTHPAPAWLKRSNRTVHHCFQGRKSCRRCPLRSSQLQHRGTHPYSKSARERFCDERRPSGAQKAESRRETPVSSLPSCLGGRVRGWLKHRQVSVIRGLGPVKPDLLQVSGWLRSPA
jgi:hypothetical protein